MTDHNESNSERHMAADTTERLLPGQQIASLGSRLAPRKSRSGEPAGAHPKPDDREQGRPASHPGPATGRASAQPPKGQRPDATRSVTRNVGFSLDIGTQDALRKAARQAETSQAEIIYEALERYVAAGGKARTEADVPPDALFQRPSASASTGRRTVHTLRLPGRNVEVIDDLVNKTGHPSRSALVEAALATHLNNPDVSTGRSTE